MVISIDAILEPVGSIKDWLRPNTSTPLPGGWLICDGSTVVDSDSPFNGLAIPDMRSRFKRGHASLDNSNFGVDASYFTGGTIPAGGVDSNNLSHQHGGTSHQHTVPGHGHTIQADGSHSHGGSVGDTTGTAPGGGGIEAPVAFFGPSTKHNHVVSTESSHTHTIGTSSPSVGASAVTSNFALGATENRPAYRELVQIIKIKKS